VLDEPASTGDVRYDTLLAVGLAYALSMHDLPAAQWMEAAPPLNPEWLWDGDGIASSEFREYIRRNVLALFASNRCAKLGSRQRSADRDRGSRHRGSVCSTTEPHGRRTAGRGAGKNGQCDCIASRSPHDATRGRGSVAVAGSSRAVWNVLVHGEGNH
jgi:hypothetical protein